MDSVLDEYFLFTPYKLSEEFINLDVNLLELYESISDAIDYKNIDCISSR